MTILGVRGWASAHPGSESPVSPHHPCLVDVRMVKSLKMSPKRRTDLKIWPSKVKNLEELDFDVRKSLAPRKSAENNEKPKTNPKVFPIFFFWKKFRMFFFGFSLFSADFRGARLFLTSKSSSSRFFALDGQIFRSVRPLGLIFRFFTVRTSTCGGKARVMEIPEGGLCPPRPPPG